MKLHTDEAWHPCPGDRIEGRRIRTAPAMEQILPYFMPHRNGADNFYEDAVEITELERYIRRRRRAQELHDGEIVDRKYIDLRFTLDERICDGFYYACVIQYFLRLLTRPEVLDTLPEAVETDIP